MHILFFDTETTGLPLWKEPSDHPDQPHIVDLAIELWSNGEMADSFDAIVNPGVPIPDEIAEIHGITTERAIAEGIAKADAVNRFHAFVRQADLIVGHNVSFDIRMMRIETARVTGDKWENMLPTFCTMRKTTNVCKIPSAKPRHAQDWKWPRLGEAVHHMFGEEFEDAHRAAPDCAATRRIYFELQQRQLAA